MDKSKFMRNLLSMFPYWNYTIMRNFRNYIRDIDNMGNQMEVDTYYTLQVIRWFEGLNMTDLASHLRITKQQATHKVDRLCEAGHVERRYDEADRRSIRLYVTPEAARQLDTYHETVQGFIRFFEVNLSPQDIETFNQGMEAMLTVFPKLDGADING